ncbi:hypothetical protein SAMN05421636_11153 [Pricia antarctica]|uniref:Uncharacterized protein n=1 Tax=Pricia antarctica TaxID=641691 RepID=A0A1G7I943_9FLAO|nr:hypothetical protein SAMN05421636_11153 [Pricia antarctica]
MRHLLPKEIKENYYTGRNEYIGYFIVIGLKTKFQMENSLQAAAHVLHTSAQSLQC